MQRTIKRKVKKKHNILSMIKSDLVVNGKKIKYDKFTLDVFKEDIKVSEIAERYLYSPTFMKYTIELNIDDTGIQNIARLV